MNKKQCRGRVWKTKLPLAHRRPEEVALGTWFVACTSGHSGWLRSYYPTQAEALAAVLKHVKEQRS